MAGIWYLSPKNTPLRLVFSVSCQLATETSASFWVPPSTPALLTAKCRPPNSATVLRIAFSTFSASATSPAMRRTLPPAERIASAVSSSRAARRPKIATAAPRDASSRATAAPIPVPAPVTNADRPANSLDLSIGLPSWFVRFGNGFPLAGMLRSHQRLDDLLNVQCAPEARSCIAQALDGALQLMEGERHGITGERPELVIDAHMRC